jgi:hypothetical protein
VNTRSHSGLFYVQITEYTLEGKKVSEWKLYRKVNYVFYMECTVSEGLAVLM